MFGEFAGNAPERLQTKEWLLDQQDRLVFRQPTKILYKLVL